MPANADLLEIAIRVRTINQLFNVLDASPLREKDLDEDIDEFVVGWVRELPTGTLFKIVIELPAVEVSNPETTRLGDAFAHYFEHRAEVARRELRELFRLGWRSLIIGLAMLAACTLGSQLATRLIGSPTAANFLSEGLIIVGWVANWRPLEIYLYDWWPIRRRIKLLRHIAAAPVEVRAA
jgi:hypothetical protein